MHSFFYIFSLLNSTHKTNKLWRTGSSKRIPLRERSRWILHIKKRFKNLIGEKITRSKERNRERTLRLVVRERSEIKEEKGGKRSTHCERHDANGKRSSLGLWINKSSVLDPSTTKQERREKKDLWQRRTDWDPFLRILEAEKAMGGRWGRRLFSFVRMDLLWTRLTMRLIYSTDRGRVVRPRRILSTAMPSI